LRFSNLPLASWKHNYVVVKKEDPFLLALSLFIYNDFLERLCELQDAVFGQSDGKIVALVLLPRREFELQNVIQLDSCLGHHILQLIEVQILKLLDFGVIVEGAIVDADYPLSEADVGVIDFSTFSWFLLKPGTQLINQSFVFPHLIQILIYKIQQRGYF